MGYRRAFPAAQIVGIDIEPQPDYPFEFHQADATTVTQQVLATFDLIHASPPCQAFSVATPTDHNHPDLIEPVRNLIGQYPHAIENVKAAGLQADLMLCGSMFGLQVQRHRYFEHNLGFIVPPKPCNHKEWRDGHAWTVTGHANGRNAKSARAKTAWMDIEHGQELMEMPWATKARGIVEAIPPAYTEWIGNQWAK